MGKPSRRVAGLPSTPLRYAQAERCMVEAHANVTCSKYRAHEIRSGFPALSFRARPQAATRNPRLHPWIPAFAGMTDSVECL